MLSENKSSIVLENDYAQITVSKKNSAVEKIIDKKTGNDIKSEDTEFFSFETKEGEKIAVTGLSLKGELLKVETANGSFDVEVKVFDSYFTFEVKTKMPQGVFKSHLAHMKYNYDYTDKNNTGAVGIAMTIWVNPMFYPDAKSLETDAVIYPHLGDVEAKYGLLIAPIVEHHDLLQTMFLTVDRNKGIVSKTGGVWGRDSRRNFGNYIIHHDTSPSFIKANMPYYKSLGVDYVDFHKGGGTYRQGDFKIMKYDSVEEFKKNVTDVFAAEGIGIGLHTYSWYIEYNCDTILSKPENLHQIGVMASFTLAEDIDENADFIPTVESTEGISMDRGFCRTNSPFILIDDELMTFNKGVNGMIVTKRGHSGTKITSHKKGAVVKHLDGHYNGLAPKFGSELFYQIARNTADLYNKGGFKMIYLDALDGARFHCDIKNEYWFYKTAFTHEVLKHCHDDPLLEAADYGTAMYAARGRVGAWDYPYRGYRDWNEKHANDNKNCIDRFLEPILGWYNFYPMTDMYPGNEHTKYQHTDDIEHMGALAIKYDFANVFSGSQETFNRYAGLRRNITLYKKYDELRKAQYFSEEYRQKLIDCPWEVQLIEKRGKKFSFVEKNYQKKRLYDLNDENRNKAEYKNPFGAQIPFIRIEAFMSTAKNNPFVLLPLDENKDLITQKLEAKYGGEIDLSNNLAKVVRVCGNGIKGGKICINLRCATNSEQGYAEYIIDTDFKGWREFILLETDNGERKDHNFEEGVWLYSVYRSSFNNNRMTGIDIMTEGDMTGVKMSSVIAYEHTYEVHKNPTVKIGEMGVMFECELQSGDFIEFDGKTAKVIDRFANEKPIWFTSNLKAPRGKFKAELTARALNRGTPRAQMTFGFTGKEIK